MQEEKQIIKDTFFNYLADGKKEASVFYAWNLLKEKKLNVVELYEEVLTPALNSTFLDEDKKMKIWNEHIRSGIVRTIVECSYPFVLEMKKEVGSANNKSAVILCPPEEYHDIGARMVADFLTICGVETLFIGANTPYEDCLEAIAITKPDIIGISISNYYNLIGAERMIEKLRATIDYPATVIVGGSALSGNDGIGKRLLADYEVYRFLDIKKIVEIVQKGGII